MKRMDVYRFEHVASIMTTFNTLQMGPPGYLENLEIASNQVTMRTHCRRNGPEIPE